MLIRTPRCLYSPWGSLLIIAAAANLHTLTVPTTLIWRVLKSTWVSRTPLAVAITPLITWETSYQLWRCQHSLLLLLPFQIPSLCSLSLLSRFVRRPHSFWRIEDSSAIWLIVFLILRWDLQQQPCSLFLEMIGHMQVRSLKHHQLPQPPILNWVSF